MIIWLVLGFVFFIFDVAVNHHKLCKLHNNSAKIIVVSLAAIADLALWPVLVIICISKHEFI